MLLNYQAKRRNQSNQHWRRFYTPLDMAIVKHDEAVHNAELKREKKKGVMKAIIECGCGFEGCFLHVERQEV